MGVEIAISLLLGLIDRAAQISTLINTARTEKRDITQTELDILAAQDDAARKALDDAIKAAKAAGR